LPLCSRSPEPFISSVSHRLVFAILVFAIFKPSHEGSFEFESVAAFGLKEPANILSAAIGFRNRCHTRYWAAMPIKRYHGCAFGSVVAYITGLPSSTVSLIQMNCL
jgi:hypothetical protein